MASNWHRVAELWLKGSVETEELVVEAALEGQLTELERFFAEHPPPTGPQPVTRHNLERFACQCAYELLSTPSWERAVHVLEQVCREPGAAQWLRDVLMSTLDSSVRQKLGKDLQNRSLITPIDTEALRTTFRVEALYTVESYSAVLESFKSCPELPFIPHVYAQYESALNSFSPRRRGASMRLSEDMQGLAFPAATDNVWKDVLGQPESKTYGSEPSTPGSSSKGERQPMHGLYFKAAADWFRGMEGEKLQRVLYEGELLMTLFNRAPAAAPSSDEPARWTAEVQYCVAHLCLKEATEKLESIPEGCRVAGSVAVFQNHVEVLRFEGQTLAADLSSHCTSFILASIEKKLLEQGIWLRTRWDRVEDWISFLAKTGALYNRSPLHADIQSLMQSSRVVAILIEFCIRHELPNVLQSFLESHSISTELDRTRSMLRTARRSDWAQWLILSRIPEQCFAAAVANAKTVLAAEGISVKTLSDLAQAESIYVVLAALAHSPRTLGKTLLLEGAVQSESPSEREELMVEDGVLCLVEPVCSLMEIVPQLQESFPETCQALTLIAQQEKECKEMTFSEFRAWRNRLLRTELGDTGFMDMVMTSDIPEIEELLRMTQLVMDTASDPAQSETAQYWEEKQIEKLQSKLQELCQKDLPEGISIGICQHLTSGRPMAAFEWFLATKMTTPAALSQEDRIFLELLTRVMSMWFYKEPCVVFATLVFAAACGIDTSKIRVDVAALQKLESTQGTTQDVSALMEDLATEVAMEYDAQLHSEGSGIASAKILGFLEHAILSACSLQPLMSSVSQIDTEAPAALSESTDVVLKWSLVHAFAKLHHKTPTTRLLVRLAQADDWILFLAESSFYQSSLQEVIGIARTQFADPHLGHHVCFILEGHHTIQRQPSVASLSASKEIDFSGPMDVVIRPTPVSEELFDILLEAENSGSPIRALLVWAKQLKWRLLCIIAACYSPSAYLECLVTWLDIQCGATDSTRRTEMQHEGSSDISRDQILTQLMHLVYDLCKNNQFDELLRGLSLFPVVPLLPIKHFLAALKYYTMHMFNATSQHLTAFEDSLDKEVKKSNAQKESMTGSVSPSMNLLTVPLDLDLVQKITQAAVIALLRSLGSPYQRQKLLDVLIRMEIEDGLPWLEELRNVRRAYKFLGTQAESCIDWSSEGSVHVPHVEIFYVLELLREQGKWVEAREWAYENDLSVEEVTKNQAEALVQEWMEFGFEEEDLSDILWEQVDQIFVEQSYPCLKAALFYVHLAATCEPALIKSLFLEALQWVDGSKMRNYEQAPRLMERLRHALYLMDTDGDIIHQLPNKAHQLAKESSLGAFCLEILERLVPQATDVQVQKAIKLLLDNGQIEAAESIQESERLAAQIEFFLVDTALAIVHRCSSNSRPIPILLCPKSGALDWNGESTERIVLVSILSYLKKKGCLMTEGEPKPQDVLDAVAQACRDSGGYPVCARAAVTFRAAILLNMSSVELANCGPNKALELLLLKGDAASEVTREFVSAFEFTPRATAKKLAQMYLNSLMGTRQISSINENEPIEDHNLLSSNTELITRSVICSDYVEIGNALMQLLVERHCVLPAEIEADILVQSYLCYEKVGYVEGLDVLLDLATSRVQDFAADEKYEAMVKVTVGICLFDGLNEALDVIVQNKKLALLFEDTNSHNPATVSILRSAILSSIYKHSPKDSQTLNVTYRHFNMHVEVGQGLKDKATELLDQHTAAGRPSRDQRLIKAMDYLIRAGAEFSCAQCSVSAADCGSLVALVAQQICYGDRKWVCLSDSECRILLPELSDIHSALIVARAYKFNTPQDWALTLWQHMVYLAKKYKGKGLNSAPVSKALNSMLVYTKGIMQEIAFSEEHLEQIMQMYVAFPQDEAAFEPDVSYEVLTQCIIQFLRGIADVQQRWNLCRLMQGAASQPLIQECQSILDLEQTVA